MLSPRLQVQSKMDSELKEIMNKRRDLHGERHLSSDKLQEAENQKASVDNHHHEPHKIDRRVLDQFDDTGDPRIDEVRERVRRHFSLISKAYEKGDGPAQDNNNSDDAEKKEEPDSVKLTTITSRDQEESQVTQIANDIDSNENVDDSPGPEIIQDNDFPTDTIEKREEYGSGDLSAPDENNIDHNEEKKTSDGRHVDADSSEIDNGTVHVENVSMVDANGVSGVYSGQFLENKPHGVGIMKYSNGNTYEGTWKHGKRNGSGFFKFASGDTFEGEFKLDSRDGHGVYRWKDGRTYEGDFELNEREGWGTFTWPNGSEYNGEFSQGQRSGGGTYLFSDGTVYVGEFKKGKFHGCGKVTFPDGRTYRGDWRKGSAEGTGVGKRADGSILHDGAWSKDAPVKQS